MPGHNATFLLIRGVKYLARALRAIRPDVDDDEIRMALAELYFGGDAEGGYRNELADRLIYRAIEEALGEGPIDPAEPEMVPPPGLLEHAGGSEQGCAIPPRLGALIDPASWWRVPREPGERP